MHSRRVDNMEDETWKKASGRGKPGIEPAIPRGMPANIDTKLYLVGQLHYDGRQWEFQGIFSTAQRADTACVDASYFYTEVTLNQELPHKTVHMDNICFPRCEIPTQSYYVVCPIHGVWCTTHDIDNVADKCMLCGSELSFKPMYP